MYDLLARITQESWLILGQMSPYLLFGFLAAGVLSVYLSAEWVRRYLGGSGYRGVFLASLFGVPLPLCSCSVIPVAVSIRESGASRAATTAFLLSTPQTGVDSIAVTYALLGPVFAIFRPVTALLSGLVGGGLVGLFGEKEKPQSLQMTGVSCCCCESSIPEPEKSKVAHALKYGFLELPRDIGMALLLGILIAGILTAVVPQDSLAAYVGGGFLSMLILMVAGVPVYVCATASVPIAAGFIHMGASAGAALAFLIAGPATNAAAVTTIWRTLGSRTAILYLITVAASALGFGLILDWLIPMAGSTVPELADQAHHEMESVWVHNGSAIVLLIILGMAYVSARYPVNEKKGESCCNNVTLDSNSHGEVNSSR
ncbi:MAG: SO_0444 family Cu/Zn efflux transporter [candidate division Zixibacteria bacterium]|nr:SO_0444 family Cu/Zn efflux transporter [candidate division Zixibacteria bacterium]